ncbi:Uroporphyrinogen-III synthase [Bordetella sputigena]|uniref:uroporphyrinogen-III synthase n=1 Tax=Bordetella sputigena TaxID=1416810 RepID=UPI0039F011EA
MHASETRTAILTRPPGRNESLATRLRTAGWQVCIWPALDIEPLPAGSAGIPLPRDFDLAVFVSGNAATQYLSQLRALGMAAWPPSCVIGAVGPATAARVRESGSLDELCTIVHPALDAPRHDSEALWDLLAARGPIPRRVLLVRGTAGRDWLAEQLRGHGAEVHAHAVYRRVSVRWDGDALAQLRRWADADCHPTWLLTSGASVEAVRANVDGVASQDWWQGCRFVLTHPRLVELLGVPAARAAASVRLCAPADDAIFNAFVSG